VKRHISQKNVLSLEGKSNKKGDWNAYLGEDRHTSYEKNSTFNFVRTTATGRVIQQLLLAIQKERGIKIKAFIHLQFGTISKTFLLRVFHTTRYCTIQHLPGMIF
jgi:hypothetical protein